VAPNTMHSKICQMAWQQDETMCMHVTKSIMQTAGTQYMALQRLPWEGALALPAKHVTKEPL